MGPIHAYLSFTILISKFSIFASSLYGEFPGNFDNETHININIHFISAPDKVLLQATDERKNSFFIRTKKSPSKSDSLIIELNGKIYQHKISQIRNMPKVSRLKIVLMIRDNNLYEIIGASLILVLSDIFKRNLETSENPFPKNLRKKSKFSIGYDENSAENYAPHSKIIGCIHLFQINSIPIIFTSNGNSFDPICWKSQIENLLPFEENFELKQNRKIYYHFCDCKLTSINTADHCYKNLGQNLHLTGLRSFRVLNNSQSAIAVKLAWRTRFNRCLLDIRFRNHSSIVIYIDKYIKEVQMKIFDNNLKKSFTKSLFLINIVKIHLLMVNYDNNELIIKLSNGEQLTKLILPYYDLMEFIDVGSGSEKGICQTLGNEFEFQYDKIKLELFNIRKVNYKQFLVIAIAPLLLLIFTFIVFLIMRRVGARKPIKTEDLNIYDNSIELRQNIKDSKIKKEDSLYDEG